ncbi:thioredoxin [Telmatospirillum sp.]|uniref:thioredoxin n=1 Tax=Telmatospirillum sp. TaxID=2079197 RepID=UPI002845A9A6|nr:thioredoxin [Telmatospirillum sp.]MDR3440659.1 thioredoxin [Telmatospirillum sp.]
MEFLLNNGTKAAKPSAGSFVKDSDTAHFVEDVLEASTKVPVIVDFWATWCGPCKTLGPLLEKLVTAAGGAVRLVKIDVDKNQELAAQMRIQSIPAVYAFKDGRPIDGFVGAVPESQVKELIQRLAGDKAGAMGVEDVLTEAKAALDAGDTSAAMTLFHEVLAQDPENATAVGGSLRCLVAAGQIDEAKRVLASLPDSLSKHADVVAVQTTIELAEQAAKAGPTQDLRRAVEANPDDFQARFDLAMACFAAGDREAAVDELLELFRRNRTWNDDAARQQLVKLFDAFGPADPLTKSGRRRLSSLMFS